MIDARDIAYAVRDRLDLDPPDPIDEDVDVTEVVFRGAFSEIVDPSFDIVTPDGRRFTVTVEETSPEG